MVEPSSRSDDREPGPGPTAAKGPPRSLIVITGATGYIGTALVARARRAGIDTVAATRRPPADGSSWLPYQLLEAHPIDLPPGTLAVVHLAATTDAALTSPEEELAAARRLLAGCLRAGAGLVFVSSQTARPDAPTAYGRGKWLIEQAVLQAGQAVVRPGLVYGGERRGLFGKLVSLVQTLPVLPALAPAPSVHPIHVDDLADALLAVTTRPPASTGPLEIGAEVPTSFTTFLRALATWHLRQRKLFLPVPSRPLRWLLRRLPERWRQGLKLGQLISLLDLPTMAPGPALAALQISLRGLPEGMAGSAGPGRRALARECRTLLTYVLKAPPPPHLLRRFLRCILQVRDGQPLALPGLVHACPLLVGCLEVRADRRDPRLQELAWRIQAASLLAEASLACPDRFLPDPEGRPWWLAAWGLAGSATKAGLMSLVSLGLGPVLRLAWPSRG